MNKEIYLMNAMIYLLYLKQRMVVIFLVQMTYLMKMKTQKKLNSTVLMIFSMNLIPVQIILIKKTLIRVQIILTKKTMIRVQNILNKKTMILVQIILTKKTMIPAQMILTKTLIQVQIIQTMIIILMMNNPQIINVDLSQSNWKTCWCLKYWILVTKNCLQYF